MKRILIPLLLCSFLCVGCTTKTGETPITTTAEYEGTVAEIKDAEYFSNESGGNMIRVHFDYTNNNSDGMYMYESFIVKAFQNDTELGNFTDVNLDSDCANLIHEVKDGQSISGSYIFQLNDSSTVEVRVCTPTADEVILAKQTFDN